ncbi:hypothetical protein ANANG_G00240380 [Anguilla anguilla]|uniref:Soluble interferon alpha/beta receptor OPG204 n=1 Tax=Anguilla anguilla TaxID=7936 RepID=A0A9D3RNT8_ANGAN|nr:hypothetical protein ANANG_G00240380 [Anguilla anguilla]
MHWIHTSSGLLPLDRMLTVTLVSTCCLLFSEATSDVTSPKILRPKSRKIKASLGEPLVIPCKADPGFTDDLTLIYWLVNRSFVEHAYPDGRIRAGPEETKTRGSRTFMRRDLVFQQIAREDFEATYMCVVTNAAGIDTRELRLKRYGERRNPDPN